MLFLKLAITSLSRLFMLCWSAVFYIFSCFKIAGTVLCRFKGPLPGPFCSDSCQLVLGWTVGTHRCLFLMCVILELKRHPADHFVYFFPLGWWECEYHLLSEPVSLGKIVSWPQNTLLWRGAISFLCTNPEWCQGLPPCWLFF